MDPAEGRRGAESFDTNGQIVARFRNVGIIGTAGQVTSSGVEIRARGSRNGRNYQRQRQAVSRVSQGFRRRKHRQAFTVQTHVSRRMYSSLVGKNEFLSALQTRITDGRRGLRNVQKRKTTGGPEKKRFGDFTQFDVYVADSIENRTGI